MAYNDTDTKDNDTPLFIPDEPEEGDEATEGTAPENEEAYEGYDEPEASDEPATVSEAQPVSGRDALVSRLKGRHPDSDFTNDDDLYDRIGSDYDDYDAQLNEYRDGYDRLNNFIGKDPYAAQFFTDWADGTDPVVALVRRYGTEIRDILDDPDRQDELAAANADYVSRVERNKALEDEYQQNLAVSLAEVEKLQQAQGLTDDQIDQAMAMLIGIAQDAIVGKFAPSTVELALKAVNHDTDVAAAQEQGQIQGRNARIAEQLKRPRPSDGVPALDGANNPAVAQRRQSIFDMAAQA